MFPQPSSLLDLSRFLDLADVGEPSADARRDGGSATLPPARSPLWLRTVDSADGIGVEPAGGATAQTAEKEAPLKELDLSRFRFSLNLHRPKPGRDGIG